MAVEIVVVRRPRKLSSQLPRIEGLPWQWQRMAADGRGNCCGLTPAEIAVAIAADFRGLPWLLPRSLPRTEPRHVPWPEPWHVPWKRHEQQNAVAFAVETGEFPR